MVGWRIGERKLPVHCGGGLADENCQCGVVCALTIKEATEVYLYLTEAVE